MGDRGQRASTAARASAATLASTAIRASAASEQAWRRGQHKRAWVSMAFARLPRARPGVFGCLGAHGKPLARTSHGCTESRGPRMASDVMVASAAADGDGLLDAAEFARLVTRLHAEAGGLYY